MLKKIFILILFIVLYSGNSFSQVNRTQAMGGLTYSILDRDNHLISYSLDGNPAWLFINEKETYLRISPSLGNSWGDYHKVYDSEGTFDANATFTGIKTLGELGTFYGSTSYSYENRRNYYRTLKKDTYAGEAFYFTDTTSADFWYQGPQVQLMYSWPLLKDLYAGGSIYYEVLNGLKKKYVFAKTIYRDLNANFGLAYNVTNNFIAGASIKYNSSQEAIECADVNLTDVEVKNYRGETYYIAAKSSSITDKIQKQGVTFGTQLYWDDGEKIYLSLQCNYNPANTKVLKPYKSISDTEDGYSAFEYLDVIFKGQYKISDDFLVGIYSTYSNDNSWSKNSMTDLLTWEWKIKRVTGGIGATYKVFPTLLLGLEYEYSSADVDSSKYIDRIFRKFTSGDHLVRAGVEYNLYENIFLRLGFNYGKVEHDILYGGENCKFLKVTGGVGFPLFDKMKVNAGIQYNSLTPGGTTSVFRKYLSGNIMIELNTF
jgi:opacity protein-like surface antigen